MAELPTDSIDRLIREAGAERVSEEAVKVLARYLEEYAIKIAKVAVDFAKHAGRKTVKAEDIKLAIEYLEGPQWPRGKWPRRKWP